VSRCCRCLVSGRVQGVWYRASTREQAQRLGLSGYAKNLHDGRVEVLACGGSEALEALQRWLWQGPERADVSEVRCSVIGEQVPGGEFLTL